MKFITLLSFFLSVQFIWAQSFITPYERSKTEETATYEQCIEFYKSLEKKFPTIKRKVFGPTDAGLPLEIVMYSADKQFDPINWHKQGKVVILVNNGIHPGEPDGIDASMMLLRDIVTNKTKLPSNVVLAIIPVYNIGGSLNRTAYSRVNQNGPKEYGFRGNAQNLDLNRDFIKNDSRNAKEFSKIFHFLNPDIFIDNHVSDGADYQHTMTLLTTQHNKLGGQIGTYMNQVFEPMIYSDMKKKGWNLIPYVNFEISNPDRGWVAYFEGPRYSSGYAALFQTMAFVPETHMLKPYAERVKSTYDLMVSFANIASKEAAQIKEKRKNSREEMQKATQLPLNWKVDTTKWQTVTFEGYETGKKPSLVTGMERMYYDRTKPYSKDIRFFNFFQPASFIQKPIAYVIPQGWHAVIDLLKNNQVQLSPLKKDTVLTLEVYKIDDTKTQTRPYEKHYRHFDTKISTVTQQIALRKGDFLIYTGQPADRFLMEVLEPLGDDSYFSWNFFDAILQQKEGYSSYRWEDVAAEFINKNPNIRKLLDQKKAEDPKFAANAAAQLDFVYKNSPYYEPAHMRYPVFRLVK